MKALVISGGGSKGAFAGGVAEYLIKECDGDYDIYVGSSTGSLLINHLALGKVDKIKNAFTNVKQKDIFNINPFWTKTVGGHVEVTINHFNVLRTFFRKRKTFGESKNLRKLIKNIFTLEEFEALKSQNKEVLVTVSNLSTYKKELKSNFDCEYNDFIDWIWASSNYVPFMSLMEKNGFEYADGGFSAYAPIQTAIDKGATSIDVIVLETQQMVRNSLPSTNAFSTSLKVIFHMMDQISQNDLAIGKLKANQKDVQLRFFHLPRVLTETPLIFNPQEMTTWWEEGFMYAQEMVPNCTQLNSVKDDLQGL
ncbi:patatin-like phospholipase family protein [Putridiphycobacter roseus]|uniref:Patatin-like phospholipase family protein n=1 Tax=Putridiphycobacter roseus TaxID=2219161 RepID=A0A2W1NDL1_9FLAO|nr:patatin-like phospholipase family protein [Putridiphycobacter roseus]PZE17515.1 patatin-like phospholipase family protein [Putridiphycobacter roseus]